MPDDWKPDPVTYVEEIAQKYALMVPIEKCFLRKSDAVKKYNPRTDR